MISSFSFNKKDIFLDLFLLINQTRYIHLNVRNPNLLPKGEGEGQYKKTHPSPCRFYAT
jgi:hypothetical protein